MAQREAPPARPRRGAFAVPLPVMVLTTLLGLAARAQEPAILPFRWVGSVPQGASVQVDNPWGDVRLRAGDPGVTLEVLASRQPGGPEGRPPEVTVVAEGAVLRVQVTARPAPGARPPRADLVLFLPGRTAVAVSTGGGLIDAKGLRGDATLSTERGEILAKGVRGDLCARSGSGPITAELETAPGRAQRLESRTGDLTAYLWEDAAATVEAATSGEISTDFSLQVDYRKSEEPSKRATAVIGGGEARLTITSRQGRVRLLRLPRSFPKEGPHAPKPAVPTP